MAVIPIDREDLAALLSFAEQHGALADVRSRYDVGDLSNPTDGSIPLDSAGGVCVDHVELNYGDVRVRFLSTADGEPLRSGDVVCTRNALIEVDGIDTRRILAAEFDPVDYSIDEILRVRLTLLPKVPDIQIRPSK